MSRRLDVEAIIAIAIGIMVGKALIWLLSTILSMIAQAVGV